MTKMPLYCLALLSVTFALGGCAGAQQLAKTLAMGPPQLADGQQTTLLADSIAVRNGLQQQLATTPGVRTAYHPVTCAFSEAMGPGYTGTLNLSLAAVKNRLFVSMQGPSQDNQYLIDQSGSTYDLNSLDIKTLRTKLTADAYNKVLEKLKNNSATAPVAKYIHVLNNFTIFVPHFTQPPQQPGDAVADVLEENGEVWGSYVYRGTLSYRGTQSELFDLVRTQQGTGKQFVNGFLVFDTKNMVPILIHISSGLTTNTLEQVSCHS
jgi:hypothetical protein